MAPRVALCIFWVNLFSDHFSDIFQQSRIRRALGTDVLPVFSKFLSDVVCLFCVAGAIFGEVGE